MYNFLEWISHLEHRKPTLTFQKELTTPSALEVYSKSLLTHLLRHPYPYPHPLPNSPFLIFYRQAVIIRQTSRRNSNLWPPLYMQRCLQISFRPADLTRHWSPNLYTRIQHYPSVQFHPFIFLPTRKTNKWASVFNGYFAQLKLIMIYLISSANHLTRPPFSDHSLFFRFSSPAKTQFSRDD